MPLITIHLDDELYQRLTHRARDTGLSVSALLQLAIDDVAWRGRRDVYTDQDELLTIAIHTFALVVEMACDHSAQLAERGVARARLMLRERELLDAGSDSVKGRGRWHRSDREDA